MPSDERREWGGEREEGKGRSAGMSGERDRIGECKESVMGGAVTDVLDKSLKCKYLGCGCVWLESVLLVRSVS